MVRVFSVGMMVAALACVPIASANCNGSDDGAGRGGGTEPGFQ